LSLAQLLEKKTTRKSMYTMIAGKDNGGRKISKKKE
jgi:hypothetical protein